MRPAIAFIDFLSGDGREGGANIATRDLAAHLHGAGATTRIFSFRDGITLPLPGFLKTTPLLRELTSLPLGGRKGMREAERLYDIIHINSLALAPLYRSSRPVVATLHNIQRQKFTRCMESGRYPLLFNRYSRFPFSQLEKRATGNIDAFICVHRGIADFLREEMGVPGERITTIPNGVDTELFKPGGKRDRRVIFVGRATAAKGFHTLMRAAPMIDAPVLAVTNKIKPAVAVEAGGLGIEIKRNLSHHELAPEVARSRLLVLPSWDEEQPLAVIEAMACGIPVVTTPVGASDLIVDGRNGYVVPPDDPHALASAVNRILDDEETASRMGDSGRRLAERDHAWPGVIARVMDVYQRVLRGFTTP